MNISPLFQPLTLRGVTFKNRIVLPSMVTHYAACDGQVSERLIAYHAARARGGAGLNILESSAVSAAGRSHTPGVGIFDDRFIKGLRRLTSAIHAEGGKAAIQLNQTGRLAKPVVSHHPRMLVSFVPGYTKNDDAWVMDEEDIENTIQDFVLAAGRAVEAGFDVIEIHGAHGYLISQFMSPLFNRRSDAWGGSYEGRMRFAVEVIERIRRRVGQQYPLFFRCSVEEFLPGGIDLELACCIASTVAEHGIDLFHVSVGLAETNELTGPPSCIPAGWNGPRAGRIRQALGGRAKVAVAGRIINRASAEAILNQNQADMVVMGRALIADPDLPRKLSEGGDARILPCISCNEGCVARVAEQKPMECALNYRAGRELEYPPHKAAASKQVVVVGGGPAGMEAALGAARRGHKVTLMEKGGRLGGLLHLAARPPHKEIIAELAAWYTRALAEAGVQVRLNHSPDVAELQAPTPDALLLATGSLPLIPAFAASGPAVTADHILDGSVQPGHKVLILGGGLIGTECAEFLAEQGREVSILELRPALALDMQTRARKLLLARLEKLGVQSLLQTEILGISEQGVVKVRNRYGSVFELPGFDTVVLALGYRSDPSLAAALSDAHMPFTPLGDAVQAGKIMNAVHQGFCAAQAI